MERLKSFLELCSDLWCRYMHAGALWPMHGSYQCRECFRMRVVPWTDERPTAASVAAKQLVLIKSKRFVEDSHLSAA